MVLGVFNSLARIGLSSCIRVRVFEEVSIPRARLPPLLAAEHKGDVMAAIGQRSWLTIWVALLMSALLEGCSQLPLDGPSVRDISAGATTTSSVDRGVIAFDYALVDISPIVLDTLAEVGIDSIFNTFGARRSAPPEIRVGVGDVLQVSIFESSVGGLFDPQSAGKVGNFTTLPSQSVSRAGMIFIPYAGSIQAAQRSPSEIERAIERKLENRAIQPQVMISVVEQNAAKVTIVGDTVNGEFKLSNSGERVLDIISKAGGLKYPGYELFVTLQRSDRRATIKFPRLVDDPRENIYVRPGDTIYVYHEQHKFVAVGALGASGQTSGLTGQFPFEQDRLSLNEAIAKAGGLQDLRADPGQVFLYRLERRESLEKMGVNLSKLPTGLNSIPTIYRANFRDPSAFFFAQKFQMRDKDLIYVANSDLTEFTKFLVYLRTVTSTVSGVASDYAITRDVLAGR